jgi:hypothetical protein
MPDHLKQLVMSCIEGSHFYRNQWYWGGEAKLRATGDKLQLRTIPAEEWKAVEDAAEKFWEEIAQRSERSKKVVDIFKQYRAVRNKAGGIYSAG